MVLTRSQARKKATFPFLDLPAELRTAIYHLALGGRIIHVDRGGGSHEKQSETDARTSVCEASILDKESYALKRLPVDRREGLGNSSRHNACNTPAAKNLPLSFLSVCKQIHQEAALVPFQANRFTFWNRKSLARFLRYLKPKQQNAITAMILYQVHIQSGWESASHRSLKAPRLLGLREVLICVELAPGDYLPFFGEGESIVSQTIQDDRVSGMGKLKAPKLNRVEVLINNSSLGHIPPLTSAEIKAWEGRIKDMMLAK
ncbi:hypothetical protein LTR37_000460 [Vermiconidia calcicola]|uniref:Uncharacterized protein n=1 Tax=Vermiconidia calcicola TaxID=1690605 RepID=A0ACC3NYW4_9PEZI|nr:hypothetical protein LTR37_000460 [Vermiconidia calcicola]